MVKGLYHQIRQVWKKPDKAIQKERMIEWRKSSVFSRVERPLRLDRARALGYKAKRGFVIIRVRVKRGGHKRPRPNKKRRSKRLHTRKNLKLNYQKIAELRAAKKYKSLKVLNSYKIGKDGMHYFFEIILVDPSKPEIKSDKQLKYLQPKK